MGKKKGRKEVLPELPEPDHEVDDLAARLLAEMETDESETQATAAPEAVPAASPAPAPTGPKRNRRREKLAQREAELQRQMDEAAAELKDQPDERKIEMDTLKAKFATRNLIEVDILPDGNCLFSSVSDQLKVASDLDVSHTQLRSQAAAHLLANRDDFAPFLEEDIDEYCKRLGTTSMWGGELEILALSTIYKCPIEVVQTSGSHIVGEDNPGPTLVVSYYQKMYGLGAHYNSVRPAAAV